VRYFYKFGKTSQRCGPLILNGSYEEAYALFKELGDYKDSEEYLSRFRYVPVKINTTLDFLDAEYSNDNAKKDLKNFFPNLRLIIQNPYRLY